MTEPVPLFILFSLFFWLMLSKVPKELSGLFCSLYFVFLLPILVFCIWGEFAYLRVCYIVMVIWLAKTWGCIILTKILFPNYELTGPHNWGSWKVLRLVEGDKYFNNHIEVWNISAQHHYHFPQPVRVRCWSMRLHYKREV